MSSCHSPAARAATIDPVCGMTVDPTTTPFRAERGGGTVFFCSAQCRDRFLAEAPAPGGAVGRGAMGAAALLAVYFGLLSALQGWAFALDQFRSFWPFIITLALGFGVQVGLFTHLHRASHAPGSGKVVAASGTTSALAMVSCCAHYLVSFLPAIGATGLVAFVADYQIELFWFGIAANLLGILYVGRAVVRLRHGAAMVIVLAVALAWPSSGSAQSLSPQVNKEGQVTVTVTPLIIVGDALTFRVKLETHSVALDQDMTAVALLVADGREVKASGWEGAPAGGHHREGVLTFKPGGERPKNLVLKLRNIGPVAERTFSWTAP